LVGLKGISLRIHRILVPIDFSQPNQLANDYASQLAMANEAQLIYLHVLEEGGQIGKTSAGELGRDRQQLGQHLKILQPGCANVKATHVIKQGTPAGTIIDFARKNQIDLIVMGTHGRTGLSRVLMGGVAEQVVQQAPCPVMTINLNQARKC
jgi:universal stress protein A